MTRILHPLEYDHLVQGIYDRTGGECAECLCGWDGRWTKEDSTADAAEASDRDQIDQPSATNGTSAAIVDRQDDLAGAITLLAD